VLARLCRAFLSALSRLQPKMLAYLSWTPDGVRYEYSDRVIIEEKQHGPIHRRLPLRQRPN
jgi:hypothetical protein